MKNILPGLIIMSVFLPQASFGQIVSCSQKIDTESRDFFQQQAQDRGAFINANHVIVTKQDKQGKWRLAHKRTDDTSSMPQGLTAPEQATLDAFVAKQLSDKQAFLGKLDLERQQNCTNSPADTSLPVSP